MRFVDANILIYAIAGDRVHGRRSGDILLRIEGGEAATTSTLVISQVCAYLRKKGGQGAIPTFLDYLQNMHALAKDPTSFDDFTRGAAMGRDHSLPGRFWDDLVIASQMGRLGVKEIYSADADFDRIPGVRRIF